MTLAPWKFVPARLKDKILTIIMITYLETAGVLQCDLSQQPLVALVTLPSPDVSLLCANLRVHIERAHTRAIHVVVELEALA